MPVDNGAAAKGEVVGPESRVEAPPLALEIESTKHALSLVVTTDSTGGFAVVSVTPAVNRPGPRFRQAAFASTGRDAQLRALSAAIAVSSKVAAANLHAVTAKWNLRSYGNDKLDLD